MNCLKAITDTFRAFDFNYESLKPSFDDGYENAFLSMEEVLNRAKFELHSETRAISAASKRSRLVRVSKDYDKHRPQNCCGGCLGYLFIVLGVGYLIFKVVEIVGMNVDYKEKSIAIPAGLFGSKQFKLPKESLHFAFGVQNPSNFWNGANNDYIEFEVFRMTKQQKLERVQGLEV